MPRRRPYSTLPKLVDWSSDEFETCGRLRRNVSNRVSCETCFWHRWILFDFIFLLMWLLLFDRWRILIVLYSGVLCVQRYCRSQCACVSQRLR